MARGGIMAVNAGPIGTGTTLINFRAYNSEQFGLFFSLWDPESNISEAPHPSIPRPFKPSRVGMGRERAKR